MKFIRLGTDINIVWQINRYDYPEDFAGKDITVHLLSKCGCAVPFNFYLEEGKIKGTFYGKDQVECGSYRLELVENEGKEEMVTLDYVDAFCISKTLKNRTTSGQDSTSNLKTESVELTSTININGFIERDPVFRASPAGTITDENINDWNSKVNQEQLAYYTPKENFDRLVNIYNEGANNQNNFNNTVKTGLLDLSKNKADKSEIPDVSIYNPTNNFKTINYESIIGTGNITIQIPVTSVNGATGDVVIDIPTVPTNVSAFNNDAGYVNSSQLNNYATKDEIVNNYATKDEIVNNYATKNEIVGKDVYNTFVSNQASTNSYLEDRINNLNDTKAQKDELLNKQDKLISGNNLATINGYDLLAGGNIEIQGDVTANGDNTFNGNNTFNNQVYINSTLNISDPRDSNYTSDIFNVLTEGHISQIATSNTADAVYLEGKKLVWSEEQNKAIIVEDANYNIKYCNVNYTIKFVYNVTNDYEAFWWNNQYTEDGADEILKKVELNSSPSNEYVGKFYVNVPVDYTEDVNVYYHYEELYTSYLAGSGFIKDAPFDNKQYVRYNGYWTVVEGGQTVFYNDHIRDADEWLTQGYNTTHENCANLPIHMWGIIFFATENDGWKAGYQTYVPIDGDKAGKMYKRAISGSSTQHDAEIKAALVPGSRVIARTDGSGRWMTIYPWSEIATVEQMPTIPTNVSAFNNDAGYLTEHQDISNLATRDELNSKQDTLVSGNNIATINGHDLLAGGNIEIQGSSAVTSVNGQTGDVTIEIPTNVSQLNNDAGYLTEHQDLSNYATTEFVNTATNNGHIVWTGTQSEYDALSDKTVYLIYLIKK